MQISQHLNNIVKLISNSDCTLISSATGTGKSTAIPLALSEIGSKVFIAVPTVNATISLAEYQKYLNPNVSVGFAAGNDIQYRDDTMIVYATSRHIMKKMLSYFSDGVINDIDFTDVIICDEIHTGNIDNTIIISLWLEARNKGNFVPRLVLSSATPIPFNFSPKPVEYIVNDKQFPIEFKYVDNNITNIPDELEMQNILRIAAKTAFDIHINNPIEKGHILIFVPGSKYVEVCLKYLEEIKKDNKIPGKLSTIIPAFGALKQKDLALIHKSTATNERKIIVATNVIETSITINDIGFVIDTMLEKLSETTQSGGLRLSLHYISKDSAIQRAGRTGRTIAGVCYRLCSKKFYEQLEEHRVEEINRVPIYEIIMELLSKGLSPQNILKDTAPTVAYKLQKSIDLLYQLGMISKNGRSTYVTEVGHFSTNLPLSVRNSAFLYSWINGGRFNSFIINGGKEFNLNLEHMEIDETSEYSSIKPWHMKSMEEILKNVNPKSIIDATANVGGDMVNFLRIFPETKLTAIEIDTNISSILRRNVENLPLILNNKRKYDVKVINMSALKYFENYHYSDLIFFDPPWGEDYGEHYQKNEKISLQLDNIGIGSLIKVIFESGMTNLVLLKAPIKLIEDSYEIMINFDELMNDIGINVETDFHVVESTLEKANPYALIIFRYNIKIPLISEKEEETVSLRKYTRPIFPGIVASCIMNSFDTSFFYVPRQEKDKKKYFDRFLGYNDLETYLNMWNDLWKYLYDDKEDNFSELKPGDINVSKWCKNNSINRKKITELIATIQNTVKTFDDVITGPFTTNGVMRASRSILLKVYSDSVFLHKYKDVYYDILNRQEYHLDRNSFNRLRDDLPLGVIAIMTAQYGKNKIIIFAVDTNKNGLGKPIKKYIPKTKSEGFSDESLKGFFRKSSEIKLKGNNIFKIAKKIIGGDDKINNIEGLTTSLNNFYGVNANIETWSSKPSKREDRYDNILKYVGINPEIYLDIGSGDGNDFELISNKINSSRSITSDIKDHRKDRKGEFYQIEIDKNLPFENESIDVITMFHILHHSTDSLFRLNDMARILKKNGILIIKDHNVVTEEDANNVNFEHFVYSVGEGKANINDISRYHEIEKMYFYKADYIRDYMNKLGFTELFYQSYPGPTKIYYAVFQKNNI